MTFTDDTVAMSLLPFFGEDKLMWASDYPHPVSSFPHSQAVFAAQMASLPADVVRKLTWDNAVSLYGKPS